MTKDFEVTVFSDVETFSYFIFSATYPSMHLWSQCRRRVPTAAAWLVMKGESRSLSPFMLEQRKPLCHLRIYFMVPLESAHSCSPRPNTQKTKVLNRSSSPFPQG